jgi:hypothetical protein
MMMQFAAEVLFPSFDAVPDAAEALAAAGCSYEIDHNTFDPDSSYVFGFVVGTTELAEIDIGRWVSRIVGPHGGDVVEWAYGEPWKIGE